MTKQTGPIARTVLAAQSDERLVRLLREGHEPAFDEIVRRYRGPLVGFATAIVNHDRAEDVVQTALEKAHRALLADAREINLRPWLFTIVRNGSLNLIRSEPVTDELDPLLSATRVSDPEQVAERNEEMDRLFTAICALPGAQREALVRRELEGVGHGEIASQLGTTATAVRGLIFRARTQLRNAMGALVPLPVLRTLIAEGSAAGIAGGGAGAAALFGSAGAKGGAAVAAAVVALGAGIAVEKHHGGDHDGDVAVAQAAGEDSRGSRGSRAGGGSSRVVPIAATPRNDGRAAGDGDGAGGKNPTAPGSHGSGDRSEPGSGGSPGSSGPGSSGSGGSGSGHSGSDDDSGSSGSSPEPPEHDDDNSGHGGSSGSSGHGSSGYEDDGDEEEPEEPEVEEPEHDSSGPGDGYEEPEDDDSSDDDSHEGRH